MGENFSHFCKEAEEEEKKGGGALLVFKAGDYKRVRIRRFILLQVLFAAIVLQMRTR